MSYRIRRAAPGEAEELTALAQGAKANLGYPPDWLNAWREELTITEEYLVRHNVFVADTGSGLAGVAALEQLGTEAVLEHVWVAANHQGRGVGAVLVRHGVALARKTDHTTVRVVADSHAVAFYERLGGRVTGSIPAPMPGMPERTLPVLPWRCGGERRAVERARVELRS